MLRVTGGFRHETRYFFGCTTSVPRVLQRRNMVCLNERSGLRKMWRTCGMLLPRARVDLQYAMLKLWGCLTLLFGVLTVHLDTQCFFVAEAVVRKLCTQRSIVFRDGILPWHGTLKCRRNFFCVTITDSAFLKKVSTTNARCWELHGNWNCKTLCFQTYPYHGNCTLCLHIIAVQKTSGSAGRPWSPKDPGHSCNTRQAVHFTTVNSHREISASPEISPQLDYFTVQCSDY